jgi:hypothetical protein
VIRAENGDEAELAIAEPGAGAIDLIMHLNRPTNGRELVDRMALENPDIKVLFTSGTMI